MAAYESVPDVRAISRHSDAEDGNARLIFAERSQPARPRWLLVGLAAASLLLLAGGLATKLQPASSPHMASVDMRHGHLKSAIAAYEKNCGVQDSVAYELVSVLHNNLGGSGPDEGKEGIIYKMDAVTIDGWRKAYRLEVNAMSPYSFPDPKQNNLKDDLGQIMQNSGDEVRLKFTIKEFKKDQVYAPSTFHLTLFDIDEDKEGKAPAYVVAHGPEHSYTLSEHSTVQRKERGDGHIFLATEKGSVADNPKFPKDLPKLQKRRAVTFTYHDAAHIEMTFGSKSEANRRLQKGLGSAATQFAPVNALVVCTGGGFWGGVERTAKGNWRKFLAFTKTRLAWMIFTYVVGLLTVAWVIFGCTMKGYYSRLGYILHLRDMTDQERSVRDAKMLPMPDNPMDASKKKLAALDCPANAGWTVISKEGPAVVCRCGGGMGSHTLKRTEIIRELDGVGCNGKSFEAFLDKNKEKFVGQKVDHLVTSYLSGDSEDVRQMNQAYEQDRRAIQRHNSWVF